MNTSGVNFLISPNSTANYREFIQTLYTCVHSINFLFGIPTHFYVIILIIAGARSGVALEFFKLNLSICEVFLCLTSLFCLIIYWTGALDLIIMVKFLLGLGILGRSVFQCLMCVERYLAVVHPVIFLKYKPLRYRVFCCSMVWIVILSSCFLGMFTLRYYHVYVFLYSVQVFLLLSIQMFCLVAVLIALKQSGPGNRLKEKEIDNPMKKRAFVLILVTTVSSLVTYILFTFSGIFSILENEKSTNVFFSSGLICNVLAGFVQPLFHLHQNGKLSFFLC